MTISVDGDLPQIAVEQVSRNLRGNQVVHVKGSPEKLEVSRSFTHLFKQM